MRHPAIVLASFVAITMAVACGGSKSATTPTSPTTSNPTRVISLAGSLAFGEVPLGATKEATLTVSNSGSAPLSFTGLTISSGLVSHFAASPTSGQVPAGGSTPILVRFQPQSSGAFNGTLSVTADHTSGTNTIAISGTGVAPPVAVFGVVADANTSRGIVDVTVSAANGPTTRTDGNGYYHLAPVPGGTVTLSYSASGYNAQTSTVSVTTDTRRDVKLVPFWRASGVGDTVFDMPTSVRRVRIKGYYPSRSSNFVVRIAGRLVVNELLGTAWPGGQRYEGLFTTTGGLVEITISRDVQWEFIQEQ